MSFQSYGFLLLTAGMILGCLLAARWNRRAGQGLLTLGCGVCYLLGDGGAWGLAVLLAGCAVTHWTVRTRRWAWGAAWHIAVLLVFKYTGFLTGGAVSIGWSPVGLSFFTFQQLWVLKPCASGRFAFQPGDSLTLFALFFPTVTSGPILRPEDFFPQTRQAAFLHPTWQDAGAGLYAFSLGLAKKTLLADNLAVVVANGWAMGEDMTAPAAWAVIFGYTLRLYFDFSGYCDMATGLARLLGIRLPRNFDSPYRSVSVGAFWKRWHMTLTAFLRECVYFPLGGSREGTWKTCRNILIVYLISGLWHGAGWTFLLWGLLHGLAQVAERLLGARLTRLPKGLRWGGTFLFVSIAWVFFQAADVGGAWHVLTAAVTGGWHAAPETLAAGLWDNERTAIAALLPALGDALPALALAGLFLVSAGAAFWPQNLQSRMETVSPTPGRAVGCALLAVWSILSFSGVTTFIYSNF